LLSQEQSQQAHRNIVEAHWSFIRRFPRARRETWPEGTVIGCGFPSPDANHLVLTVPPVDLRALVERARHFFLPGFPFEIVASAPGEGDPFAAAGPLGPGPSRREPGMWLDLPPTLQPPPAGLSILTVSDREALSELRRLLGSVYHIPQGVLRTIFPASMLREEASSSGVRLILARSGGRAVAGSVLVATEGVAGVYWVATDRRARRRGYGAAATWGALAAGRELGARAGFLQASPLGLPVYERMGFRTVLQYQIWQPARPRVDRWRTGLRLLGSVLASSLRRDPA
jgi:GNAT superfamily N-acetyltransferase